MDVIRSANLALRFALELCALAAAAYWGASGNGGRASRILLAVATPLAIGVLWILFVAPGATIPTSPWVRLLVELAVFLSAVVALLQRGRVALAVALGVCYAINRALMEAWDQ